MHWDGDLIVIFMGVAAIVFISSFFGYIKRRDRANLIEKLIDKGQTLSPDILASITDSKGHPRVGGVGAAVSLILTGIALGVFFWAMGDYGVPNFLPFVGLFPIAAGVARLIGLVFDRPKDR